MQNIQFSSKILLFTILLFLGFSSCTIVKSKIDLGKNYNWEKETSIYFEGFKSSSSAGDIFLNVKSKKVKAKYEVFYMSPSNWRIEIRGAFNVNLASIIISNSGTFIFDGKKWVRESWLFISNEYFGTFLPPDVFNLMFGFYYSFQGECVKEEIKICKNSSIYFALDKSENPFELKTENLSIIFKDGTWFGKGKQSSFKISQHKKSIIRDPDISIFETKLYEKDPFEDL